MDKILVRLYVPMLEEEYDMYLPTHRRIGNIIKLLVKSISELNDNYYEPKKRPKLYDKITGEDFDVNLKLKDSSIKNGAELVLI